MCVKEQKRERREMCAANHRKVAGLKLQERDSRRYQSESGLEVPGHHLLIPGHCDHPDTHRANVSFTGALGLLHGSFCIVVFCELYVFFMFMSSA